MDGKKTNKGNAVRRTDKKPNINSLFIYHLDLSLNIEHYRPQVASSLILISHIYFISTKKKGIASGPVFE